MTTLLPLAPFAVLLLVPPDLSAMPPDVAMLGESVKGGGGAAGIRCGGPWRRRAR